MASHHHMQQQFLELLSNLLLFGLVFGMSATIELTRLIHQLHNTHALGIGMTLQFVVLPLLGYLVTITCAPHSPVIGLVQLRESAEHR